MAPPTPPGKEHLAKKIHTQRLPGGKGLVQPGKEQVRGQARPRDQAALAHPLVPAAGTNIPRERRGAEAGRAVF